MTRLSTKNVAIIVAHPDDETLWTGGTILNHPTWHFFIICLCRESDEDRSARFHNALKIYHAEGIMGDLDDGPEQNPLEEKEVERVILDLLPSKHFDLIITHSRKGEYTRHLRHEETNKAVIKLWHSGKIVAHELWTFAYEDGQKAYYPKSIEKATLCRTLSKRIWLSKYKIITETYGFNKESWEAQTTPKTESFWQYVNAHEAKKTLEIKE